MTQQAVKTTAVGKPWAQAPLQGDSSAPGSSIVCQPALACTGPLQRDLGVSAPEVPAPGP